MPIIGLSEIKNTEPNRDMGSLSELKKSIEKIGLINPITVTEEYELLAGRRRFHTVKELGWKEIPCRVLGGQDPLLNLKITIDENLKRKPLTDPEISAQIKEYDELKRKLYGEKPAGNPNLNRSQCDQLGWSYQQTAKDLQISKPAVVKAIKIAEAVERRPELAERKGGQIIKELKLEEHKEKLENIKPIRGKFDVLYADPPWKYDFSKSDNRAIENQYPTMDVSEICNLSVPSAENCVLFLWTPMPKLKEGLKVMEAWGFEYKTGMVWVKDKIGMGYYIRGKHELILIGTKGNSLIPEPKNRPDSVIIAPRTKHSEKPKSVYGIIEKMYPDLRYVELFARNGTSGWDSWGDEV